MDWGGTTTSANATGSHLDMRSMAQALHDDLSQVHFERESVRACFYMVDICHSTVGIVARTAG